MKKIQSFPSPLPDEDYRNLVFRYQLQTPYESVIHSRTDLFGEARNKNRKKLYPENLNQLDQNLGMGGEFALEIVRDHTFFLFLRPFLSEQEIHECEQAMFQPGYLRNPILSKRLRPYISDKEKYCPSCLDSDYQAYGVSYMHRTHQFYFLTHCHIHGEKLVHACPTCNEPLTNKPCSQMLFSPYCSKGHPIYGLEETQGGELSFQQIMIHEFTELMGIETSIDKVKLRLFISAGNQGYVHYKGDYIYKQRLVNDLTEYIGIENIESLGIQVEELCSVSFITSMFQVSSIQKNILFYILLMRFFGGSVKGFFSLSEGYSIALPFGTGPWRCMNYICPDYYQKVIKSCKRKSHEWVTGIFTCPTCGMIYTRAGMPKPEDETQYSIETMGSLFIETAVKYYEEGYLINEISTFLSSNKTTIRKYLAPFRGKIRRAKKSVDIEAARNVIEMGYHEAAAASFSKVEVCKQTVLEAIASLGDVATRPSIRKYNIHRYDWLMKREREWMENVLPPKQVLPKVLDRATMDDEMTKLVAEAVEKCWGNPPERIIGIKAIFKWLPTNMYARYVNHKTILPQTTKIIEEGLETLDQYAIRNLPRVIEWFEQSRYKSLTLRLVQSKTHFYKRLQPDTLKYIEETLDRYMKREGI